ncbi:MAG: adenylate/guanylate cyclase domain-containing protein [Terrimicrobiaceae bacterium]|nr:adenylate/guanylate cyclase domain-containing protein [Terrimicrobiaceae bacterium]
MQAKLKVRPGEGEPFEVEIANTATIGRGRDNTVSLHMSPHVSRQHAIIRCHNAWQYQIMDLGSRNGTFVNGRRVITPVILEHGAVIRITNNELVFEQHESAPGEGTIEVTLAAGTDPTHDESCTVAIMVCDIRGFSTMSEILPEDVLARTLGEWFREAGNLVQQAAGTIDKFIGDAILAYWIAGSEPGAEARRAFETGRALLTKAGSHGWPGHSDKPFRIAVALHHGVVTCGNIGLVAQRDATIIGDAVNTVFRMEGVMKQFNQRLTASADFVGCLGEADRSEFRDLGEHQLKGKNQLVRLMGWEAHGTTVAG